MCERVGVGPNWACMGHGTGAREDDLSRYLDGMSLV